MITSYEFARACYQSSKFLLCIVKFNFASWNLNLHRETLLYHERLLCSMKNCFASRNIVVYREKLFCITKDCYVPWKIVLYHERLLCTVKNCFVSRKIVVYREKLFCITKDCCVSSSILSCVLPLWATIGLHLQQKVGWALGNESGYFQYTWMSQ